MWAAVTTFGEGQMLTWLFCVRFNCILFRSCEQLYRVHDVNVCCHEGIDHLLAQHIAHLFIRDPVSMFTERIHLDDSRDTEHFEVSDYNRVTLFIICYF